MTGVDQATDDVIDPHGLIDAYPTFIAGLVARLAAPRLIDRRVGRDTEPVDAEITLLSRCGPALAAPPSR